MQGTWIWPLVWEYPTFCGATKPACHNYWAYEPQVLKGKHLGPVPCNKRGHHNEKSMPCNQEESGPHPLQLEKAHTQHQRRSPAINLKRKIQLRNEWMNESMTPEQIKSVTWILLESERGTLAFKMVATHICPCLVIMGKFTCLLDHPKGAQSWVFIGRTDVEAETPIFWPPDAKSWLIGKDSDAGRDWGQEEKGTTEHEMAGWHHRLDGHESEWTPGVGDGQGGLACCSSCGRKESDMTEWLNWTELIWQSNTPDGSKKQCYIQKVLFPPSSLPLSFFKPIYWTTMDSLLKINTSS